jgi:hypothetical protein
VVLGCRCGVELVVCVSVVRVWLCFGVVVWFFGAVFGWAFGCQRACGVCSRLLEMADFRPSPRAGRESRFLPRPRGRLGGGRVEKPMQRHLVIPIADPEFIITPLLQVPPASRGEPRTGSVPPACRGNLKEGVINCCFCELWLGDRYNTNRRVKVY